jgi:hemerythrin superfamily protein
MKHQRNARSDIVTLLLADHEQIQHRLEAFRRDRADADPNSLRELISFLVAHETSEELVVYPAVRRHSAGGAAVAEDRLREQTEAAYLLRDIEKTPFGEADFWNLIDQLTTAVLRHAQAEERSFFRSLSVSLEAGENQKMAQKYIWAMKAAPTHPHPLTPHSPPLEVAITPAVALIDRARDRLSLRQGGGEDRKDSGSDDVDGPGDVLSLLSGDHRALNLLTIQLETQAESTPTSILDEFSTRLAAHTTVELEVVYPALRHYSRSDDDLNVVKQGRLDHEEVAISLDRLHRAPLNTVEFRQELGHLIVETRLHIERDQQDMFPRLRVLSPEVLQALAMEARKARRHAPERPHPHAPKSGPGGKLADRVLALTDKARRHAS